tara:strand:+ start:114 stop:764 length:651 start_codon:yes stop_codon:yes gene_type:complete
MKGNKMYFFKILNANEIKTCTEKLKDYHAFSDGKKTQPTSVMKSNTESLNIPDEVRKLITDKLYDTHFMDTVYCPNRVSVNFYNQYVEDDHYDIHVDEFKARPKSNNTFFDYGFSVNLLDDYEGGEFILQTPMGQIAKRLEAGEIALFPIIYPHGVGNITKGKRVNIIGWMSTNISYEQSFILYNMFQIGQAVKADTTTFTKVNLVQNYLKKEWSK